MNIVSGWSTEFAKLRFGIELEETDFLDLCVQHDLDPGKFTPMEKFLLMYDETQVISAMVKVKSGQWPGSDQELATNKAKQTERITVLKVKQKTQ
jgi:hypothetical protein